MGPAIAALGEMLAPALGTAFKALVRTTAAVVVAGGLGLGLALWLVTGRGPWALILVAFIGLAALVAVTGLLAVKNAVAEGVLQAVRRAGLGKALVGALFGKLGVSPASAHGERGGLVGKALERVPLRDAAERLRGGVTSLIGERAGSSGVRAFLARALMKRALSFIEVWSLERFRQQSATHGGVDLERVRDELASVADEQLTRAVSSQLMRLNALIAAGYLGGLAALVLAVRSAFPGT